MSHQQPPRPPTRRLPLGEVTRRVNNTKQQQPKHHSKTSPVPHHKGLSQEGLLQVYNTSQGSHGPQGDIQPVEELAREGSRSSDVLNPRLSAISKEYPATDSKRNSQISTVSTNASDGKRLKSYIGPWKLGKTLGEGATARVRLARQAYTGQEAAIKIVQKKNAQMSQAGSLAALDQSEATLPDSEDGMRRMPVGIEREVAIMKLIQHPNIMKLYDIWENRTEIYLVLEYVDNGELFEHITAKGRLNEEEAVKYFRQILSAVGYCHSFNICHRDLKPENILLTKEGDIKIADFGMAALHQSPDHKLKTSCGSPHYAAPELIRGANYRGDKVDIWSMGVILYATLAGRLPFDVEGCGKDWLAPLLSKIRKGSYEMAHEFSEDAANLIWRILQVNPRDRISLNQIWRHPLVRKYDYLDDYGSGYNPQSLPLKECGRPVLRRSDINKELLRHLRSMWHRLTEYELMEALLCEEPNDQKLFYTLLLKYRDAQLENYTPHVGYSSSDYHHVRPPALTKTYSTCDFPQPKSKGHGRQISRFTVISNVAETEQSYDPFKASRPQHLDSIRGPDHAKITVHRSRPGTRENEETQTEAVAGLHDIVDRGRKSSRSSTLMLAGGDMGRRQNLAAPRGFTTRSSLASSTRSRGRSSAPFVRAQGVYKRGVSFSHIRKQSTISQRKGSADAKSTLAAERHRNHGGVTDGGCETLNWDSDAAVSPDFIRPRTAQSTLSQTTVPEPRPVRATQLWTEDVRQLSSTLAKDCDEAFNRSSIISSVEPQQVKILSEKPFSSPQSNETDKLPSKLLPNRNQQATLSQQRKRASLDARPLPPPPARSESVKIELLEARKQAELRKTSGGDDSPRYLDRMVSHIDCLIQPSSPINPFLDRRAISAPADTKLSVPTRPLPPIHAASDGEATRNTDFEKFIESQRESNAKTRRVASTPEPRALNSRNKKYDAHDRFSRPESHARETIRLVDPSSPGSPVQAPAPLTIRKKSSSQGVPLPAKTGSNNGRYSTRHRPLEPELRQQYLNGSSMDVTSDLGRIDEDQSNDVHVADDSNPDIILKSKPKWFKRNSKIGNENEFRASIREVDILPNQSGSDTIASHLDGELPIPPKKRGFSLGRLFKKRHSKPDMTVTTNDIINDDASVQQSIAEGQRQPHMGRVSTYEDPRARQIEPQQSWLAKLFHVKPASKFICFSVSKRRARQEITSILKEWKRYGIRDVQVDKERNIVFGKVGLQNFLNMKEVAFAGEIMTVIEHGKRSHLSIARFTQERGAASSFHKVVETLEHVLKGRGMLVVDERKARMMVKTLNAA